MGTHTAVKEAKLVLPLEVNGLPTSISVPGTIFSAVKSDRNTKKALSQFCPESDCQQPIRYRLFCDEDHGPYQRDEVLRGRVVDGKTVIVDEEEAQEAAKSSLARGKLDLTIVDRASFIDGTMAVGTPYHFMPTPKDAQDTEAYSILYSAITDNPDWAFVCRAHLGRGSEVIVSVERGAYGGLTIQPHAYPELLYNLPEYEHKKLSKKDAANVRTLLADRVGSFDPDDWHDNLAAQVDSLVDQSSKGKRTKSKTVKEKETKPSLLSAIAASAEAS